MVSKNQVIENFVPYEAFSVSIHVWPVVSITRNINKFITDIFIEWAIKAEYNGRYSFCFSEKKLYIEDQDFCADFKLSYELGVFDE